MTLPIGFWVSPPKHELSLARFQEIRDAGFTHINDFNNWEGETDGIRVSMDYAWQCGLKYIVNDARVTKLEDEEQLAQFVQEFSDHPAYLGHYLYDEPGVAMFDRLGSIAERYYKIVPSGMAYINLYPTYASPSTQLGDTYPNYLDKYCRKVKLTVLSYDHYPLWVAQPEQATGISADYFDNLQQIRNKSLEIGIPFWVFIQTVAIDNFLRAPTAEELLWQVNMSLAYGAKGIQYFTYWTPSDANGEVFGEAMIDRQGNRTERYEEVRRINQQLKDIGAVLINCKSVDVIHKDGHLSKDSRIALNPFLEIEGDPIVIGCLEDNLGFRKWMIVNKSFQQSATIRLNVEANCLQSLSVWRNGVRHRLHHADGEQWIRLDLMPGEGQLLESL